MSEKSITKKELENLYNAIEHMNDNKTIPISCKFLKELIQMALKQFL